MLSIILNDNELDLFEDTEIVWQWTAFRFQTAIRDGYSNNFSIPKTTHNVKVLGVFSLFDTPEVQFEGRLQPAVINLNGKIMPIYIQVVSLNEKEIEVCIFEDRLIYTIKGKELNVEDTQNTIFEWNEHSYQLYPEVFKLYNYGAPYIPKYAQLHPSIKINDILNKIGEQHNVNVQNTSYLWRMICTKRYVCPQNTKQVIELNTTGELEDDRFTLFGGQHITNDLCSAGTNEITFNRHTEVDMRVWWSYYKKGTTTNHYYVYIKKNGENIGLIPLNPFYSASNAISNYSVTFEEGDKLSFEFSAGNKFRSVSLVVRMNHSNYEITEDDYSTTLEYKGRRPRLKTYDGNGYIYNYFDGNRIYPTTSQNGMTTENLSFSYFGLWCNIPKVTIGELLYSLQYVLNARVVQKNDDIIFENFYDKSHEVQGEMTRLLFHSTSVGKNNYLRWADGENQPPVVTFTNEWLVNEKVWSKNCFKWIKNDRVVPQYSLNFEQNVESESGSTSAEELAAALFNYEYNDFDQPVILFFLPPHNQPPVMHTFGLDRINNCKEIQLELNNTPPDITNTDTIFLDGREYYIIEGEKNFKTGKTIIKALLIV